MKHLVISKITKRKTQRKVEDNMHRIQLICKDAASETGVTVVFTKVKADTAEKALAEAAKIFPIGTRIAARPQEVIPADGTAPVTTWHYFDTSANALQELQLSNEAFQLRLMEAKALASIATRKHSEAELAAMLD